MASAEKRTRSQLALSDDLLLHLSQGSPLKDARTALRHRTEPVGVVEETDEPSIPTTRTTKRSVSPPPADEYAFKPKSSSDGRQLKRMKLDDNGLNGHQPTMHVLPARPAYTRSLSQPRSIKDLTRARSAASSASGQTELTVKGRARSVPLFPSSLSSGIVYIDLRNPPASPRRQRSRSPSKERELCIIPGPATTKLDTIRDEADSAMNVEQDSNSLPQPTTCEDQNSEFDVPPIVNESTTGTILEDRLPPPTPSKKPPLLSVVVEPPATPVREPSPLSPLTPISETPFPSSPTSENNRYVGTGSSTKIQAPVSPAPPLKPSLGLATMTKSRLPRPSSSTNLALSTTQPSKAIPPPRKPVASSSTKPSTTAPQVNNAFAVLMANARESKNQVKGKGKGKVTVPKVASSGLKSTSGPSRPPRKGKILDTGKVKEVEASPPKPSLKSKMKPKTAPKPKPKPKPSSPVIPSPPPEAGEMEPSPPPSTSLPRSPSPARSIPSARPTTPLVQDISMESIDPVIEPNVPMEVDVSLSAEPSYSNEGVEAPATAQESPVELVEPGLPGVPSAPVEPTGSDIFGETHVSDIERVVKIPFAGDVCFAVDNATSADRSKTTISSAESTIADPSINSAPAKPTTTKAHISKRKPSAIPAPTRITRSVSLKRNQKVSEIPKGLPTKVAGKKVLVKQKSLTALVPEVVASGSSSKSSDEVPQDAAPPTSSFSTEPVNVGSPEKMGSPVKPKTPRSSYAQPTKSAMIKQVSPKKPSLSKLRNPSPTKLARSVSMHSRPREKLQQRPPERPNTSMGFSRDDPDSSIELENTSKDDNSIQSSGSDDPKTASSSKGMASSSRPVQRTLFGGARSSLTGKFTVGSLGSGTRGTSGFKVSGQPSKTGPRIFGVGGGLFSGAMRARTMQKASRKTSLPSVMASPVKGGKAGDAMDITDDDVLRGDAQDPDVIPLDTSTDNMAPDNDKGKGKERITEPWNFEMSLAPQALSQSLNVSSAKGVGLMGPPATPKGRKALRSVSSTYPSTSSGAEASGRVSPTRTSLLLVDKTSDNGASGDNLTTAVPTTNQPESLQFLKDCIIFVDVRNDDGDDVGSLFVEMLEGVGARACFDIMFDFVHSLPSYPDSDPSRSNVYTYCVQERLDEHT
ncbi:hypothetical protein C0989_012089 [Termitomyces sp. Mn162]|nr:hypothetical protein C0989_012089 [Termitomyces sp. Mn162]